MTPSSPLGSVSVTVRNPDGGSVTKASAFTYGVPTIYFSDDFESGLGKWQPGSGGVVVSSAGHGGILTFNRTAAGGDIWSAATVPAGAYLSFDYAGVGGFIGVSKDDWLAGQSGYPALEQALVYDSTWRHYEVQVRTTGPIMVETWSNGPGEPYSASFDNIVVAAYPGAALWPPVVVLQPTNQTLPSGSSA
jgi:hypothetical protein